MTLCPAGHESSADDYCDVCGLPIPAGGAAAPPPPAPPPTPGTGIPDPAPASPSPSDTTCPNCDAVNPENALFCEACGYDFTTGQVPRPLAPPENPLEGPGTPSGSTAPATPVDAPDAGGLSLDTPTNPKGVQVGTPGDLAPPLTASWVAEVWIDPDWYAEQDSSDPLPSAGVPTVVPLRSTSVLVGRTSRSRNIHPDIDLTADNGVSRRHCQLTTDGTRWWVEDLGSSNGTYVGSSVGPLPQVPVPPGEKREIAPDERLYLGTWTRIVIRRAQPGEV